MKPRSKKETVMDQHEPSRLSFSLPQVFLAPRPPSVGFRYGRGRTGGTTNLDLIIQLALAAGRPVLVGDGDRRNPTLSGLYPPASEGGALEPPASDETADVKDWVTSSIGTAISRRQSLLIDLSGGDRAMQEYGRDLGVTELCQAHGFEPLGFFSCGPEMDDFDHVLSIWNQGYFRPKNSILILNEHLILQGRTPQGAFDPILARPELVDLMAAGMTPMFMPRLPCMGEMRRAGLSFLDAATGMPGPDGRPFDPVRQFMVRQFVSKVLGELGRIGALEWLP